MSGAPTQAALLELASRVEAASGPDRELDARIWWAVHQNAETDAEWRPKFEANAAAACDELWGRGWRGADYLKLFTASLDAAMTLVPEGMLFYVDSGTNDGGDCHACVVSKDNTTITGGCKGAATPALALTAAALRARAAQGDPA